MKHKTKVTLFAIAGVITVSGLAVAAQGYSEHKEMRRTFAPKKIMQQIDTNGDSSASMAEVLALVKTHFDAADRDNDGKLSKGEIVLAIDASNLPDRLKRRSGKMADRISMQGDINQDGVVELAEVENRLSKLHALADWNDDGAVELSEAKRLRSGFGRGGRKQRR